MSDRHLSSRVEVLAMLSLPWLRSCHHWSTINSSFGNVKEIMRSLVPEYRLMELIVWIDQFAS
ncbi:MAG TPA: hypothetical protein V6D30_11390 [Leptolyngbyaceae cyanobacterium]